MKSKISLLNRAIDSVRRHRSSHRSRRRRLGLPVVAMVGYTNAGKSTLLNSFTSAGVFAADMLFATLDPTTRLVRVAGLKNPDILLTDTVGFIQKLPTNLVAAFRATLEEIAEADILLHVADVSNDAWRKQEAAVLRELHSMGLSSKPIVTVWNKIDLVPERKEFLKFEALKRAQTVAVSATTMEGFPELMTAMEAALSSQMEYISSTISYNHINLLSSVHNLGMLDEVQYLDEGVFIRGRLPLFLKEQVESRVNHPEDYGDDNGDVENTNWLEYDELGGLDEAFEDEAEDVADDCDVDEVDWHGLAKGRHTAVRRFTSSLSSSTSAVVVGGRQRMRRTSSSASTKRLTVSSSSMRGMPRDELDELLLADSRGTASVVDDEFDDSLLLDFDNGDYNGLQAQARAEAAAAAAADEGSSDAM